MNRVIKCLQSEVNQKACSMCIHHLKVDDNSICLKHKKLFPMQIRKHKDEYIVSTECLGKDFSAGGDKFKLYIRLQSNNN